MSTYSEASQFKKMLSEAVNEMIENHPIVKSAIKAQKAIVWETPNTTTKTVKVKFPVDIFSQDIEGTVFPYNPNIPLNDMAVGKSVYIFYYQSINNGVIMQNENWSI